MRTAGAFQQDTPNSDGQLFMGPASDFLAIGTQPAIASAGAGLLTYTLATASTYNLYSALSQILRTGLATNYQEQFGTAAGVAGPSAVAGTSDPLGISTGIPPFLNANNPIFGPKTGFVPKGVQINYVEAIYSVVTGITSATIGITNTKFTNNVAPAVTNILALAGNSLPITAQANPFRFRVTLATPIMNVLDGSNVILNLNIVTGAGSATLYGVILGISFNYN